MRKIDQARKAWHLGTGADAEVPAFHLLTGAELEEQMGQNAFIHACVLAGQAGEGVVKRATLLETYRGKRTLAAGIGRWPEITMTRSPAQVGLRGLGQYVNGEV